MTHRIQIKLQLTGKFRLIFEFLVCFGKCGLSLKWEPDNRGTGQPGKRGRNNRGTGQPGNRRTGDRGTGELVNAAHIYFANNFRFSSFLALSPKCTLKFPLRIRRSVSQPKLLIVLQLLFA